MFKRIVVAMKFTSAGQYALEKGIGLARDHGADLHIFHALDYTLIERSDSDPRLLEEKKVVEMSFEKDVRPLLGDLNNVTFEFIPTDPALEVCKIAKAREADLIILGCHQYMEHMCLGRIDYVGMTILEKAPCPVLLVPYCD